MTNLEKTDKKLISLLLLFIVIASFYPVIKNQLKLSLQNEQSISPVARLSKISGNVKVKEGTLSLWQGARVNQKLFVGNRVLSLDNSSATINYFRDFIIKLNENTLIVIRDDEDFFNIELEDGFIALDLNNRGGKKVKFNVPGSDVSLNLSNGSYQIRKKDGQSTIFSLTKNSSVKVNGKLEKLDPGVGLVIKKDSGNIVKKYLTPISPQMSERIAFNNKGHSLSWKSNLKNTNFVVDVSRNANFTNVVQTKFVDKAMNISIPSLEPGKYYWRIKTSLDENLIESPIYNFNVFKRKRILQGKKISHDFMKRKSNFVKLSWEGAKNANYLLTIVNSQTKVSNQFPVIGNSYNWKPDEPNGTYSWSVKKIGDRSWTEAGKISLLYKDYLKAINPVKVITNPNRITTFKWNGLPGEDYEVRFTKGQNFFSPVKIFKTTKTSISTSFEDIPNNISKLYWRVYSKRFPGVSSKVYSLEIKRRESIKENKSKRRVKKSIKKKTVKNLIKPIRYQKAKHRRKNNIDYYQFRWKQEENVEFYLVELYKDKEMNKPILRRKTYKSFYWLKGDYAGKAYFRIKPMYKNKKYGAFSSVNGILFPVTSLIDGN